eukprot:1141997-Pelagomonas_calceolata.AAC.14
MLQKSSNYNNRLDYMLPSRKFLKHTTLPRLQLWDHLQRIAMPAPLLRAIKDMYQGNGYILGRDISKGIRGAMTGDGVNGVPKEHAVQPYMAAQQRMKKPSLSLCMSIT